MKDTQSQMLYKRTRHHRELENKNGERGFQSSNGSEGTQREHMQNDMYKENGISDVSQDL